MLSSFFAALIALPLQAPATLAVTDTTLGQTSAGPTATLIAGGAALFDVRGDPGELALVFADPGPAPADPPVLGGVPILVQPPASILLAAGILDGAGAFAFGAPVPAGLPAGFEIQLQAALADLATSAVRATNAVSAAAFPLVQDLAKGAKTQHPLGLPGSKPVFAPAAILIGDAPTWKSFWDEHDGALSTDPPAVDFGKYAVVAAFVGVAPTSGYWLEVDAIATQAAGLQVLATLKTPGPGCGVTFGSTNPYHYVLVPAAIAGPVLGLQVQMVAAPPCP